MLRVLMLATDLQRGGLPLRMVRLAVGLRAYGVEPIVGCLAERGPLSAWLDGQGIEEFSCDARGAHDVLCLARLARHIRRLRPDVIHASLFHANLAARLVGRLDRPRPVVTSTVTIEIERGWHRWLEALTADRSDVHVANSAAVARHVCADLGYPPGRVITIPNGVDLAAIDASTPLDRRAERLEEGVPLLVWAGRMDPVKDLTTFVEVIEILRRRRAVQAVLLGDGPDREKVNSLIHRRRLGDVIRMAPWSDQVPAWLKAADVLLFPSLTEGSPNTLLEAMACRCPVVASDLPATRELTGEGAAGLLCAAGNVQGFAASVDRILEDGELRASITETARNGVEHRHSPQAVEIQWVDLYRSLAV